MKIILYRATPVPPAAVYLLHAARTRSILLLPASLGHHGVLPHQQTVMLESLMAYSRPTTTRPTITLPFLPIGCTPAKSLFVLTMCYCTGFVRSCKWFPYHFSRCVRSWFSCSLLPQTHPTPGGARQADHITVGKNNPLPQPNRCVSPR